MFINGHSLGYNRNLENNPNWKGGEIDRKGRMVAKRRGHERQNENGYVVRSVIVVEEITGIKIRYPAVVHHVDEDCKNDVPENFVVCENLSYHIFLHKRKRAYEACGHADWLKCPFCKKYDDPKNMYVHGGTKYHRECQNKYHRTCYDKNRDEINIKRREKYKNKHINVL